MSDRSDTKKLEKLYAAAQGLPAEIDAELVRLVAGGHRQADLARLLKVSPQEINRRVFRHRDATTEGTPSAL